MTSSIEISKTLRCHNPGSLEPPPKRCMFSVLCLWAYGYWNCLKSGEKGWDPGPECWTSHHIKMASARCCVLYSPPSAFSWVRAMSLQSCPTLCNPMDCNPSGSSVHRILQARVLEWVAILFSRRSSPPRSNLGLRHCRQVLYHLSHQGSLALLFKLYVMVCFNLGNNRMTGKRWNCSRWGSRR